MATNPQFPQSRDPRRGPQRVEIERPVLLKKNRFPWLLLTIVVAAAILAALIYWLPQTPNKQAPPSSAQVPNQPTAGEIQLSAVKLTRAPIGSAIYLEGKMMNTGNTDITGVQVQARFLDAKGNTVDTETQPVETIQNGSDVAGTNLVDEPLKPSGTRGFRVYFEHIPGSWNNKMPDVKVTQVTGTSASGPAL